MGGPARARILHRFADLIEEHADDLAALECLDNGKPLLIAKLGDIPLVVSQLRYFAGWADKIQGKTIPADTSVDGSKVFAYTLREPLGVVGLM
jgi:acyl-CoA reductase-like NAD-dependent aldehyde dehydrogenase